MDQVPVSVPSHCDFRADIISAMATPEDQHYITQAVGPLCGHFQRNLEKASSIAEGHFTEYDMTEPEDRSGVTHLTRFHFRRLLKRDAALLGGWELVRERKNGQILLTRGLMQMRVLHEWPKNQVPPPGTNRARIDYWRNPDLGLFGVEASNLVAVWSVDKDGSVGIRIFRTIGTWKAGASNKVDIDFMLPETWEELSEMEFTPDDEGLIIDLPFEEDIEGDDDADASGR